MFGVGGRLINKLLRGRLLSQETTESSSSILSLLVNSERSFSSAHRTDGPYSDLSNHQSAYGGSAIPPHPIPNRPLRGERNTPPISSSRQQNQEPSQARFSGRENPERARRGREDNDLLEKLSKLENPVSNQSAHHSQTGADKHDKTAASSERGRGGRKDNDDLLEKLKSPLHSQTGADKHDKMAASSEVPTRRPKDADEIFRKMKETGLIPNAVEMLDGLCKDGLVQEAMKLFGIMREKGTMPEVVIYSAVVEGFCMAQKLDDAIRIFRKMQGKGIAPNAYSYSILIHGLCKVKRLDDAVEFCGEMLESGHSPNIRTLADVVDGLCREKSLEEAKSMVDSLRQKGFYIDEKASREYLEKRGPFSQEVWEAILGKKAPRKSSLFH